MLSLSIDDGLLYQFWHLEEKKNQYNSCKGMSLQNFMFTPSTTAKLAMTEFKRRQRGGVLQTLPAFLEVLIPTAQVKMMNHIIIPDQPSRGMGQDRKECFNFFYIFLFFFFNSHCTYFEKCHRAPLGFVSLGATWFLLLCQICREASTGKKTHQ